MKAREIRELETPVLIEKIEEKRRELWNLRMQWATNTLENPHLIEAARKELARMLTIAHERHLAASLVAGEGEGENA
jgi:large subunit ribosomal protein L29